MRWQIPIFPALKQDHEFKANLGYIMSPYFKKKKNMNKSIQFSSVSHSAMQDKARSLKYKVENYQIYTSLF
jgi:hypothetical protein